MAGRGTKDRRGGRRFRADRPSAGPAQETAAPVLDPSSQRRLATRADRVATQLLAWLADQAEGPGHPGDLALLDALSTSVAKRELDLPHFPEIPLALNAVLDLPEPPLAAIVAVVSRDPALVKELLTHANSPVYRGSARSLDDAITRVGLDEVWRIGVNLAVQSVFLVPGYQDQVTQIRDEGQEIAEVAAWLAGESRGPHFLAGALLGVGELLVIRAAAATPRRKRPRPATVAAVRAAIGPHLALLAALEWGLWETTTICMGYHQDPTGAPAAQQRSALVVGCARWAVRDALGRRMDPAQVTAWLGLLGAEDDVMVRLRAQAKVVVEKSTAE